MSKRLNDSTELTLPVRNLISLVAGTAIAVWAYFGVIEQLRNIQMTLTLLETEAAKNTEFRIKWPRGEMGILPADSEQFMLIENLSIQFDKLRAEIESGRAPYDQQQQLTLEFYEKRIEDLENSIKELTNRIIELRQSVKETHAHDEVEP